MVVRDPSCSICSASVLAKRRTRSGSVSGTTAMVRPTRTPGAESTRARSVDSRAMTRAIARAKPRERSIRAATVAWSMRATMLSRTARTDSLCVVPDSTADSPTTAPGPSHAAWRSPAGVGRNASSRPARRKQRASAASPCCTSTLPPSTRSHRNARCTHASSAGGSSAKSSNWRSDSCSRAPCRTSARSNSIRAHVGSGRRCARLVCTGARIRLVESDVDAPGAAT